MARISVRPKRVANNHPSVVFKKDTLKAIQARRISKRDTTWASGDPGLI